MFDPSAPLQIAAWIVTGVLALFTLGGCGMNLHSGYGGYDSSYVNYAPPPFYGARPAAPAQPAGYAQQPRGVTYCFRSGNAVMCS